MLRRSRCSDFSFVWCPWMAINNVSVQYIGELLLDIILLTQNVTTHRGNRFNDMERFFICSLWSHLLNVLTFFPLMGGCPEGLDAFRFFFKQVIIWLYVVIWIPLLQEDYAQKYVVGVYLFSPNEQCGGGGGGVCCQTFSFVLFSLFSRPRAGLATV